MSHFILVLALTIPCFARSDDIPKQKPAEKKLPAAKAENKKAIVATPAGALKVAKDFKAELLYSVPKEVQGSWVNMCVDPKGRLIVSDQYGPLYRISPPAIGNKEAKAKVEKLNLPLGEAHGLLWAFDSLYVVVNEANKYKRGLHRVRSRDGGDTFEKPEFLHAINGGGEHGAHAVVRAPDGKSLYVLCGNMTKMINPLAGSRVPTNWGEDHILPRMRDGNGFMAGVLGPGGCVYHVDPDGKNWELVSTGYRNPFDMAFNRDGDLFTWDADMEWDMNTPWYRPTRVCLVASGSEYGWRNGAGKWPAYFPDSLPAVFNVGPGCPTGICFGYGTHFPAAYQEALFMCDWSYGKLYALHLKPAGAAYTGEIEEFLSGSPLPLTDVVVNPKDGALYFTIGGRKTQSGLYRVSYVGKESTAPVPNGAKPGPLHELRQQLEAFHGHRDVHAVDFAWPYLGHEDRFIRYAARVAIEFQDPHVWQQRALDETDPARSLNALLALIRTVGQDPFHHPRKLKDPVPWADFEEPVFHAVRRIIWEKLPQAYRQNLSNLYAAFFAQIPGAEFREPILTSLERLHWESLTQTQRLDLLRDYQVLFNRLGRPDERTSKRLQHLFDAEFPSHSRELNAELCQLLVYLEAPNAIAKALKLMAEAPTQEEQLEYAKSLRVLRTGWTQNQRKEFFTWLAKAANFKGGASMGGFLKQIREDAVAGLAEKEKVNLKTVLESPSQTTSPTFGKTRALVKKWKLDELAPIVEAKLVNRDFERGRRLFGEAKCFSCHRFDNEGGAQGPDLTVASGRFSPRDLLESILLPSKEISDQYVAIIVATSDGKVVTGRIVNYGSEAMSIMTNMLDPNGQVQVKHDQVESIEKSKVSMMPEGLLDTFKEDEICDLIAYLLSRGDRGNKMFRK